MFSRRTSWSNHPNKLSTAFEQRLRAGLPVIDLTLSNPTQAKIDYPVTELLASLQNTRVLSYQPDPRGLLTARQAVCDYYAGKNAVLDPSDIFLTASTSESYSTLMKLLCEVGDTILVPSPSYPLFEYLAQINDVGLRNYSLAYDGRWHIEIASVKSAITPNTRAIVIINPHNPTGEFLQADEYAEIVRIATDHNCALIVDEVFIDYKFDRAGFSQTTAAAADLLTFTLNGLSKLAGLPQMKLGWIAVSGPEKLTTEAMSRLEIVSDTFLSVNTPVQVALSEFLKLGKEISTSILTRVKINYKHLQDSIREGSPCGVLNCDGGWNAIIQLPRTKSDEEWAMELLDKRGIFVYPGYFFDLRESGLIVVSLLQREEIFLRAITEIVDHIQNSL